MKDEIKLMLNIIKDVSEHKDGSRNGLMILSCKDYKTLLDYITNLQQIEQDHKETNATLMSELAKLKEENDKLKKDCQLLYKNGNKDYLELEREYINYQKQAEKITIDLTKKWQDYKSRCEKASDKLGNYKHYSTPTEEQNSENEDIVDSALNILQNGSDSQ